MGVLVDPSENEFKIFSKLNLDYFQIYGDYSEKEISKIKINYRKKTTFDETTSYHIDTFI